MKKVIIWVIILILIISWIFDHDYKIREICRQKICPVDCWFSPYHEENLEKCEKEDTYILKYFKIFY